MRHMPESRFEENSRPWPRCCRRYAVELRDPFPGNYAIVTVTSRYATTSYCNPSNAGTITLVEFVEQDGDALTRDALIGDLNLEPSVLRAQLDEIARVYPDAWSARVDSARGL